MSAAFGSEHFADVVSQGESTWMLLGPRTRAELMDRLDAVLELEQLEPTRDLLRGMIVGMTLGNAIDRDMVALAALSVLARMEGWPR